MRCCVAIGSSERSLAGEVEDTHCGLGNAKTGDRDATVALPLPANCGGS